MKHHLLFPIVALALASSLVSNFNAHGTAFTYQGRLDDNGQPANGVYDLRFSIYDAAIGGTALAGPGDVEDIGVTDGFFTAPVDLGTWFWNGQRRWLQVEVRTNGSGDYAILSPLTEITPTPYAIHALTLSTNALAGGFSGPVAFSNPANAFAGSFAGDGSGLTNVEAATLGGLASGRFWQLGGNADTIPGTDFLGTPDNRALEMKVNGARAFRLEPAPETPNVLGGVGANSITPGIKGATIAGGGLPIYPNVITADFAAIGGGTFHIAGGAWATIAGGRDNRNYSESATVAGGHANLIETNSLFASIGGGRLNRIAPSAYSSTISGGLNNSVESNAFYGVVGGGAVNTNQPNSSYATISGGLRNQVGEFVRSATVGGGENNRAMANYASVGGGLNNTNAGAGATIGGGHHNSISASGDFASVGGGFRNRAGDRAFNAVIAGGSVNTVGTDAWNAALGGGQSNVIAANALSSVVGGGQNNQILPFAIYAMVGGGERNSAEGIASVISGGSSNRAVLEFTTVSGGKSNLARFANDTVGGGGFNVAAGGAAVVSGGWYNEAHGYISAIGGGQFNKTTGNSAFVGAGSINTAEADFSVVGGGVRNNALGPVSSVGGGAWNTVAADAPFGVVGGGIGNLVNNDFAVVVGGSNNVAEGYASLIGGGTSNVIADFFGNHSIIVGGKNNTNEGSYSFMGGGGKNILRGGEYTVIAGGEDAWVGVVSHSFVGGGQNNTIGGVSSHDVLAGGQGNNIGGRASYSAIGGGRFNVMSRPAGNPDGEVPVGMTIAGGDNNYADRNFTSIGGGAVNKARGYAATVPGGASNDADGDYSVAAGRRAKAVHNGTFVWADDTNADFRSTTNKQFAVRADNGVMIQASKTALDLRGGGALEVAGAGIGTSTPVFIHRATIANTSGHITTIDHPHCNNDPNAILIVTQNWNPGGTGGVYNAHPVGVYYASGRWRIFNQDISALPENAAFNVLVFKP